MKQTVVYGTYSEANPISMTEKVHTFEITAVEEGTKEQIILYPTWAQAQQIHDAIEKTMERLKAAKADGVPISPCVRMP